MVTTETLYKNWLAGLSLRSIGRKYNLGFHTVYNRILSKYGKDACDIRKNGLARVVVSDYGDYELANKCLNVPGRYFSYHKENTLSAYQSIESLDYLPYQPEQDYETLELPKAMKIPEFIWRLEVFKGMLGVLMT
jgi:hypothetical protein